MKNERDGHRRPPSHQHGWRHFPVAGTRRYRVGRWGWWTGLVKGLTVGIVIMSVVYLIAWLFV